MLNEGCWVPHREACLFYGISRSTLRRWANNNKVVFKRNPSNHRSYFVHHNTNKTNQKQSKIDNSENYIYCRVSSNKQKDDLQRQCLFLQNKYPNHKLVKDIGSGLNYKRQGLLKLLELSNKQLVKEIVVSSKDRLCRFGFELLE